MTGPRSRIMVIDDDTPIRETLVEILEENGFEVSGASNGKIALDMLRGSAHRPSLILLDLMMPVMDGVEFREEQLRDERLASIPVVVLSAYRDAASRAEELHAAASIPKPIDLKELLAAVREHAKAQD